MNKIIIGPPLIFALFVITAVNCGPVNEYTNLHESIGVGIGHCNKWDQEELERGHLQCTRQVEERYSLILERFQVDFIPPPVASSLSSNYTRPEKKTQNVGEICNMLHDAVQKCGEIYHRCLNEDEFRQFLDGQIEIFVHLLTSLYSLGPEVNECEIVQEWERSGRKDIVRPTDKCKEDEVKRLTIRYQQCMEDANYDMTRAMLGHQANFTLAFEALCLGIDRVVHTCSDLLHNCYTLEEIEETKLGQLELMRKVFLDLINDTNEKDKKEIHWDLDIRKCGAFHNYYASPAMTISNFFSFNIFYLALTTISLAVFV